MTVTITAPNDLACLRAAVRAYRQHIQLRPATPDEALAVATEHQAYASAAESAADACLLVGPLPAEVRGRERDLGCHYAVQQRLRHLAAAADHRRRADAWRRVSPGTHGQVAEELRDRVRHYAALPGVSAAACTWALAQIA